MAKPIITEVTVTGKQGRGIYYTRGAEEPNRQPTEHHDAYQDRHLTAFLQGCNPMLRGQIERGVVGVTFDQFGHVRLIEGPNA